MAGTFSGSTEQLGLALADDATAFRSTLDDVFAGNYRDLMGTISSAQSDPDVAVALMRSRHEDRVTTQMHVLVTRQLHNYVAASASLVDHSLRILTRFDLSCAEAWRTQVDALTANPEIGFVRRLRNYMLHRKLPELAQRVVYADLPGSEPSIIGHLGLYTDELLESDRWNASDRDFIRSHGENIWLRPVIQRHGQLMWAANDWFHRSIVVVSQAAIGMIRRTDVESKALELGFVVTEHGGGYQP